MLPYLSHLVHIIHYLAYRPITLLVLLVILSCAPHHTLFQFGTQFIDTLIHSGVHLFVISSCELKVIKYIINKFVHYSFAHLFGHSLVMSLILFSVKKMVSCQKKPCLIMSYCEIIVCSILKVDSYLRRY